MVEYFIISDILQCPVCGEKSYILVVMIDPYDYDLFCLSCGYDGSMVEDFIYLFGG